MPITIKRACSAFLFFLLFLNGVSSHHRLRCVQKPSVRKRGRRRRLKEMDSFFSEAFSRSDQRLFQNYATVVFFLQLLFPFRCRQPPFFLSFRLTAIDNVHLRLSTSQARHHLWQDSVRPPAMGHHLPLALPSRPAHTLPIKPGTANYAFNSRL